MKTQSGFISNSSTTSFIIAVNKSISEQDTIFLEMLETTFNHERFSKNNPADYRRNLGDQIQELQDLRRYGEENIKKIQGILRNKEILMALEEYKKCGMPLAVRQYNKIDFKKPVSERFEDEVYNIRRELKTNEDKLSALIKEADLLKKLNNTREISYIMKFELDAMGGGKIYNQIDLMEKSGTISIIERTTT